MLGYKGFNPDMTCIDKQYEVGKTYHEDEAILCEKGMHFCIDPLDVFTYYKPTPHLSNIFCLVEADNVSDEKADDSKRVCKDLKIIKEFTLDEYYKEICKYHNCKDYMFVIQNFFLGIIDIFSNNNIIHTANIIPDSQWRDMIYLHGNNNIIIENSYYYIHACGENNILLYKQNKHYRKRNKKINHYSMCQGMKNTALIFN